MEGYSFMIEKIFLFVLDAFLLLWLISCIIFSISFFRARWRCRHKNYDWIIHRCHNESCSIRRYCECYEHIYTREEIEKIRKMIDEL